MLAKDKKDPEFIILETAKRLFFGEGKFNANATEIARAAGVNRTLINYYFRSVGHLLEIAKDAILSESRRQVDQLFADPQLSLQEKVTAIIDVFYERLREYPYSEVYLSFIHSETEILDKHDEGSIAATSIFMDQITMEMRAGNIKQYSPIQFMMNMFSLIIYPFLGERFNKAIFRIKDEQYQSYLDERKHIIIKILFN